MRTGMSQINVRLRLLFDNASTAGRLRDVIRQMLLSRGSMQRKRSNCGKPVLTAASNFLLGNSK